jgi:hypothetical protein
VSAITGARSLARKVWERDTLSTVPSREAARTAGLLGASSLMIMALRLDSRFRDSGTLIQIAHGGIVKGDGCQALARSCDNLPAS